MGAHLGALSSLPPATLGTVQGDRKTLASDTGKVVSAGNGRGHAFPQSFPLGPEPGPSADSWLGAGVLFCLGGCVCVWRGCVQLQGRGWEDGVPARLCPSCPRCPMCHHSLALPGERTLCYPNGSLPATRGPRCSRSHKAGVKRSRCLSRACGVGAACTQLPQW